MSDIRSKLREESAGVMVENVIVLPIVFVIIIFMVMSAFLIHDRSTIESAARRGATYAAHCVADPNYASLVGQSGELDLAKEVSTLNFNSVGKNIDAYRYLTGGDDVTGVVTSEVQKIMQKTRINWIPQEQFKVTCDQENKIIYQNVTVKVSAVYKLPNWLKMFGLETEYKISTEAKLAAVDPDEFIRNADLVVDLITAVDDATGGHIGKAVDKIGSMASKLMEWIDMG